jgi:hypothetical protein
MDIENRHRAACAARGAAGIVGARLARAVRQLLLRRGQRRGASALERAVQRIQRQLLAAAVRDTLGAGGRPAERKAEGAAVKAAEVRAVRLPRTAQVVPRRRRRGSRAHGGSGEQRERQQRRPGARAARAPPCHL